MPLDNQTLDEWLNLPGVGMGPTSLGTGLFIYSFKPGKDIEPDVTYDECKKLADGKDAKAFKWVPHIVASLDEIKQTACGQRCNRSCVKPGCVCDTDASDCK